MTAYSCEPGVTAEDIEGALRALSLGETEVPALAALPDERKIVFASKSMLALFRVGDLAGLSERLFAGTDAGAQRLVVLSGAPDSAPHLERLSFLLGGQQETLTFLSRRVAGAKPPLFVAAALGVKPTLLEPRAEAERREGVLNVDEIRKMLAARLGTRNNIRFLWRTDAEDKITEITPPLAEVVGEAAADLLGRDFAEYLEREPDGRLASAFARRETFSGIEVDWPIATAAAAVPVALGGLPAFDRERRFDGYRGFGVIDIGRVTAAEPRAPIGQERPRPQIGDNVVQLYPLKRPTADRQIEPGLLSSDEESAFQEIAQALREEALAESSGEEHQLAVASRQSGLGRNAAAILDRLGFGLLVSRDDIAIYANRPFLDLLGFADEDALHAAGGMKRI